MEPPTQPAEGPEWTEQLPLIQTWDRAEASLVCELLASYGIAARVASGLPHFLFPVPIGNGFQVMVARDRFGEAEALLADHLRRGWALVSGGRSRDRRSGRAGRSRRRRDFDDLPREPEPGP